MSDDRTFVSYSRSDSGFALRLAKDLRALDAVVWLDQLDIPAGARWDSAIEDALRRSSRVLVLLSPKAVASQNVLDEVSFALEEGKAVVPVLVESCTIPLRLRRLQYVDFTLGYDAAMARLLGTLGVAQGAAPQSNAHEPRSPIAGEPPIFTAPPAAAAQPVAKRTFAAVAAVAAVVVLVLAVVLWRPGRSADPPGDAPAADAATPVESAPAPVESAPAGRTPQPADSGLEALRALTRELATQTTLSAADLERLADAESKACPNQSPASACSTTAHDVVSTMFDTVCARRFGPAPPAGSDTLLSLKYESDMSICRKPYTDVWLRRMDEAGRSAIQRIRPG